jgi:bacterioferritin-associated ferredoxin
VYICICNALTDRRLKEAIAASDSQRPKEVYAACGCRAKCGKCVDLVKDLLRDHGRTPEAILPAAMDCLP